MSSEIDLDWLDEFVRKANTDAELSVIGEHFTTTFTIRFGDKRIAVKTREGKIEQITPSPKFDLDADFGFSAPIEVWRKFFQPVPPPLFHDFFAMVMRVPDFTLEGSSLKAMQNARALSRLMYVLRATGANHG